RRRERCDTLAIGHVGIAAGAHQYAWIVGCRISERLDAAHGYLVHSRHRPRRIGRRVWLKLAVALFASGDYRAAADEYEKLARSDPADAGLRLNCGIALREAALLDLARQQLEEAVRLDSGSAQAHYQLAL